MKKVLLSSFLFLSFTFSQSQTLQVDTFAFTGARDTFVVPNCVDTVYIRLWGAQGGNDGPNVPGGPGGYSEGYLPVNSGDTLWIYVGGKGTDGPGSGQNCNLAGGFNGGGNTGNTCCSNAGAGAGAGGGGTDVRRGGQTLNDRKIVAGGGSGSGDDQPGTAGGGLTGANGGTYNSVQATGGTQTAGGNVGGHYTAHACTQGTNGSFGQGGEADGNDGGGGGGGWYGGGGGPNNGPGGGGSGYIGGVVNGSMQSGVRNGNGLVILEYTPNCLGKSETHTGLVSVFPNPANDILHVKLGTVCAKAEVEMYDLTGKLVKKVSSVSVSQMSIQLNGLAPGVYFTKVKYDGNVKVVKTVIGQ